MQQDLLPGPGLARGGPRSEYQIKIHGPAAFEGMRRAGQLAEFDQFQNGRGMFALAFVRSAGAIARCGSGPFDADRSKLKGGVKGFVIYCAYLYGRNQGMGSKPLARGIVRPFTVAARVCLRQR